MALGRRRPGGLRRDAARPRVRRPHLIGHDGERAAPGHADPAGRPRFGWRSPDALGWVERRRLFPVSDLAGVLRGLATGVSALTILAVGLVVVTAWLLARTRVGLRLRAVGEHRTAARSVGLAVARTQAAAVLVSGALAGL